MNIEGMAATPDGQLLIGFRNPLPDDRALVVRLANPAALVEEGGVSASLTLAGHIDLGGLGIRSIDAIPGAGGYLIVAGAYDNVRNVRLFRWSGLVYAPAVAIDAPALAGINPEEAIVGAGRGRRRLVEFLSDDGGVKIGGTKCKKVEQDRRGFRSLTVSLDL